MRTDLPAPHLITPPTITHHRTRQENFTCRICRMVLSLLHVRLVAVAPSRYKTTPPGSLHSRGSRAGYCRRSCQSLPSRCVNALRRTLSRLPLRRGRALEGLVHCLSLSCMSDEARSSRIASLDLNCGGEDTTGGFPLAHALEVPPVLSRSIIHEPPVHSTPFTENSPVRSPFQSALSRPLDSYRCSTFGAL